MYAVNAPSRRTRTRYATYAVCKLASGDTVAFRIGQPTDLPTQDKRYQRLDGRLTGWIVDPRKGTTHVAENERPVTVRHDGRDLKVSFFEMRQVDSYGRGLGSLRHSQAFNVPYRAVRSAR